MTLTTFRQSSINERGSWTRRGETIVIDNVFGHAASGSTTELEMGHTNNRRLPPSRNIRMDWRVKVEIKEEKKLMRGVAITLNVRRTGEGLGLPKRTRLQNWKAIWVFEAFETGRKSRDQDRKEKGTARRLEMLDLRSHKTFRKLDERYAQFRLEKAKQETKLQSSYVAQTLV